MKKVLAFGTFDIFHPGHKNFLEQVKNWGDYLVVVVARDKTVEKVKGRLPINNENERRKVLEDSGLANEVILGSEEDKYQVIGQIKPDVICLGYDQEAFVEKLEEKLKEFRLSKVEIVRMQPFHPEKYKTSKLRNFEE